MDHLKLENHFVDYLEAPSKLQNTALGPNLIVRCCCTQCLQALLLLQNNTKLHQWGPLLPVFQQTGSQSLSTYCQHGSGVAEGW